MLLEKRRHRSRLTDESEMRKWYCFLNILAAPAKKRCSRVVVGVHIQFFGPLSYHYKIRCLYQSKGIYCKSHNWLLPEQDWTYIKAEMVPSEHAKNMTLLPAGGPAQGTAACGGTPINHSQIVYRQQAPQLPSRKLQVTSHRYRC